MTITVDIRPEVQAELARQAAAQGRAIEAHAASLLENAVHLPAERPHSPTGRAAQAASLMELFEPVRGLLTDEEVDTLFSRNPSTGRPADLA
jgi:plasmid stability protein